MWIHSIINFRNVICKLILLIFIRNVSTFIAHEITYDDTPIYGKLSGSLQFLEINKMYENFGCEMGWPHNTICDYRVDGRVCSYIPGVLEKTTYAFIETSFKMSSDSVPYDTYVNYLSCGVIKGINLPDNHNVVIFKDPVEIAPFEVQFGKNLHFTVYVGHRNNYFSNLLYIPLLVFIKIIGTVNSVTIRENVKYRFEQDVLYFTDTFLVMLVLDQGCHPDYYGTYCYFHCVNDYRSTCKCTSKESPENNCNVQCGPGFIYRFISYLIEGVRVLIKVCDIINRCDPILNVCYHICLISGNDTFFCENPTYQLYSQFSKTENITSNVFYSNENLHIKLFLPSFTEEFLRTETIVQFLFDPLSDVYRTQNYLKYITGHETLVTGYDTSFLNVKKFVYINLVFVEWDMVYNYYKVFYIYERIKSVGIYKTQCNTLVTNIIVLNEKLVCNSSAYPLYRVIYEWNSSSIVFKFPSNPSQVIDPKTPLNYTNISCYVHLIVQGRQNLVGSFSAYVKVSSYSYLIWTTPGDVINKDDNVTCLAFAFIEYNISVYSFPDNYNYVIYNTTVKLTRLSGGFYCFYCILKTFIKYTYIRWTNFTLLNIPSYICWYLFPYTLGGVSQCGHDGYFDDSYSIFLYFYTFKGVSFIQGIRYVKLPFRIRDTMVYLFCVVKKSNDENILNDTLHFDLSMKSYGNYSLKPNCTDFYPYIEYPDVQKISDNYAILPHYIYYFEKLNSTKNSIELFQIIIVIIFINPFILMFVFTLAYYNSSYEIDNQLIHEMLVTIVRPILRRKLSIIATEIYETFNISIGMRSYFQISSDREVNTKANTEFLHI